MRRRMGRAAPIVGAVIGRPFFLAAAQAGGHCPPLRGDLAFPQIVGRGFMSRRLTPHPLPSEAPAPRGKGFKGHTNRRAAHPLALPLGELSAKQTERVSPLFVNLIRHLLCKCHLPQVEGFNFPFLSLTRAFCRDKISCRIPSIRNIKKRSVKIHYG